MNKDLFINQLININGLIIKSKNEEHVDSDKLTVTIIKGILNNNDFKIEIVDSKYVSVSLYAPETIFYSLVKNISIFLNREPERYKISNISLGVKNYNVKWNLN